MFFKKNNFIKLEILPDGRELITSNLINDDNSEKLANLVNKFLSREDLPKILDKMLENSSKNNMKDLATNIVNQIMNYQLQFEVRPIRYGRNPVIRPTQVMKQFQTNLEGK